MSEKTPVKVAAALLRDEMNVCGDDRGCQCEDSVEWSEEIMRGVLDAVAERFDLDVASVRFLASDGYPSVGINTNEEARDLVKAWLRGGSNA
jgi:hypothetical protein